MKDRVIEPRMVKEERVTKGEKRQKDGFTVRQNTKNIVYGVDTNRVTRAQMFDILPEIVDYEYDKIVSKKLYSDIAGLEKKKNGKIEHSETSHDDSLMSYLVFRWALHFGSDLQKRFKISPMPSRNNLKTVSSSQDMLKIQGILEQANHLEGMATYNTQAFEYLKEREDKLKNGPKSYRTSLMDQLFD